MLRRIIIISWGLLSFSQVFAQINQDTSKNSEKQNPNLIIQNNTTSVPSDSVLRQEFIRDSLITREKFIKDSLYCRKQILDSLTFLKQKLPKLIEAAIKSINEEIIIYTDQVNIIGDSTLSNFTYRVLSQKTDKPYSPWRSTIKLSGNSFRIKIDTVNKKVSSVHSPEINYSFNYDSHERIVRMNGRKTIVKKPTGNYYKFPIDSVFLDRKGRVRKLKKYVHYFEATSNYQKGASLYVDIEQTKEFDYFPDGALSEYRVVNYCGRETGKNKNEVCHIVNYSLARVGRKFTVLRKNEPKNDYSDGTFIFEFDSNFDMKGMKFTNVTKKLSRNFIIELNKDRNVSRYLYEKDGRINKTLLVNYNNSPTAKYKVETTVCYFEEDGISYYQKNTTTGKSRTRNKLTMKWNPWK
ncbi:MAG: hypothetical protein ABFS35_05230 [Bacteroidota bacterium]